MRQHEYNTTQYETKRVQHEITRVQHETTSVQKNIKFLLFDLFISSLHTRSPVY